MDGQAAAMAVELPPSGWTERCDNGSNGMRKPRRLPRPAVAQPFATLLTILVIGIALALPACLHVLVQNVRDAQRRLEQRARHLGVHEAVGDAAQTKRAAERIRQRRDVDDVQLIEADEALKEFRRIQGSARRWMR